MLELELTRLDRLQMALWSDAINGSVQAVDKVLCIMEQRAKLLGLYRQADAGQPHAQRVRSSSAPRLRRMSTSPTCVRFMVSYRRHPATATDRAGS